MKQYYTYTQEQHDNIVGRVNEYLDNNQIPDFTAILDKYFPEDNNGVKPKLSSLQRFHQRKLEAQKNGDDELSRKRQRTETSSWQQSSTQSTTALSQLSPIIKQKSQDLLKRFGVKMVTIDKPTSVPHATPVIVPTPLPSNLANVHPCMYQILKQAYTEFQLDHYLGSL